MKGFVVAAAAATAVVLASGAAEAAREPARAGGGARTTLLVRVNVAVSDSKITLNKKTAGRGLVVFAVTNVGARKHNFQISGRKTRDLSHGQSATLRVTFLRKGHYTYESTLTGDTAAGLKGVFTIS